MPPRGQYRTHELQIAQLQGRAVKTRLAPFWEAVNEDFRPCHVEFNALVRFSHLFNVQMLSSPSSASEMYLMLDANLKRLALTTSSCSKYNVGC